MRTMVVHRLELSLAESYSLRAQWAYYPIKLRNSRIDAHPLSFLEVRRGKGGRIFAKLRYEHYHSHIDALPAGRTCHTVYITIYRYVHILMHSLGGAHVRYCIHNNYLQIFACEKFATHPSCC